MCLSPVMVLIAAVLYPLYVFTNFHRFFFFFHFSKLLMFFHWYSKLEVFPYTLQTMPAHLYHIIEISNSTKHRIPSSELRCVYILLFLFLFFFFPIFRCIFFLNQFHRYFIIISWVERFYNRHILLTQSRIDKAKNMLCTPNCYVHCTFDA